MQLSQESWEKGCLRVGLPLLIILWVSNASFAADSRVDLQETVAMDSFSTGGLSSSTCLTYLPGEVERAETCESTTLDKQKKEVQSWIGDLCVSVEVVQDCVEQCQCKKSRGGHVRYREAKTLCELGGKRLPTAAELLHLDKKSGVEREDVEWVLNGNELSAALKSKKGHVFHWSTNSVKRSRGKARFRCVFDAKQSREVLLGNRYTFPFSVEEKPPSDSLSKKYGEEDSWWARDQRFQKNLRKRSRLNAKTLKVGLNYRDPQQVNELLWAYHQLFPEYTRMFLLGYSHQGRPIWGLRLRYDAGESRDRTQRILINGGIHGDELLAPLYVFDSLRSLLLLVREIEKGKGKENVKDWLTRAELWFVPLVNPDGTEQYLYLSGKRNIGRKNGRNTDGLCEQNGKEGIDLNRNFPFCWGCLGEEGSHSDPTSVYFRGPQPGSEPETQAMMRLAESVRFTSSISWHTNGTMIISPYTIDGNQNPKPDVPWELAERTVARSEVQKRWRRYKVKANMYPVDGTDQDWFYHQYGTIAYIFEGSHHNPMNRGTRKRSRQGANAIFDSFIKLLSREPTLNGRVIDENGNGLEVEVRVTGFRSDKASSVLQPARLYNGERWTSRPEDGLFHRLFLERGIAEVEFSHPSYRTETRRIEVDRGHPFLEVQLTRKKVKRAEKKPSHSRD